MPIEGDCRYNFQRKRTYLTKCSVSEQRTLGQNSLPPANRPKLEVQHMTAPSQLMHACLPTPVDREAADVQDERDYGQEESHSHTCFRRVTVEAMVAPGRYDTGPRVTYQFARSERQAER